MSRDRSGTDKHIAESRCRFARGGNGYEDGYDDLSPEQLRVVKISLNTGKHPWEGAHGNPAGPSRSAPDDAKLVEALVLRRVSN